MNVSRLRRASLGFVLLAAPVCMHAQAGDTAAAPAATEPEPTDTDQRMATPPPVSVEGYPTSFGSETTRHNYLRGGVEFSSAYDDNVSPASALPVKDTSYSIWPSISLDQARSRVSWTLSYAPGFTFYQKNSELNQTDHNASTSVQYRLSPHVTLRLSDTFVKTSNLFSQYAETPGGSTTGVLQNPNIAVIAPVGEQYNNSGTVQFSYQFSPNGMVGVNGFFFDLRYPNRRQTGIGLFDSSSRAGEGFYTHRLSGRHYIGATYRFQDLLSYPGNSETQTHSATGFYTLYFTPHASLSVFAGPEYSDTSGGSIVPQRSWTPAVGGSLEWQGQHTNFFVGVSDRVTAGGGLIGASRTQAANVAIWHRLTRNWAAGAGANYSKNELLDSFAFANSNGHSISGTAFVDRQLGEHFGIRLDYMRLHQSYAGITTGALPADRNRVSGSLSYHFQRPWGR